MENWTPKVGDLVTPDPCVCRGDEYLDSKIGKTYKVVNVNHKSKNMTINYPIGGMKNGWAIKYWMPAKNQIVRDIINDL